jgi:hypothetical protein
VSCEKAVFVLESESCSSGVCSVGDQRGPDGRARGVLVAFEVV